MQRARVLIVDDDAVLGESLAAFVSREGYDVATALDAVEAMDVLEQGEGFGIVVCDLGLPGKSGLELLRDIRTAYEQISVVVLTGYGSVENAVEASRLGALDFLTKPTRDEDLRVALERAERRHTLACEQAERRAVSNTRDEAASDAAGVSGLIGEHVSMRRIYELVEAVAASRTTVLMTGESGTGKSRIARAIHELSGRREGPFVQLSCGSIPETLLESELFGHVRGAFTGAHVDKDGRFLAAHGGTIFLDEINSASQAMQLKLLRVLQERRFEAVGSSETTQVDVRVIVASNEPLEQLVADGRFRQDLYYRVNVVRVGVPALRERASDIPLLARSFLERYAAEARSYIVGFTEDAEAALARYSYPGNVRELENIVERATVVARGQRITLADLPAEVGTALKEGTAPLTFVDHACPWNGEPLAEALRGPERRIIQAALAANGWNRQKTADALGINRTTLYKKMKQLSIDDAADRLAG